VWLRRGDVEYRCLGFGGKGLLEYSERLGDLRQRFLALERRAILEHLGGDERIGVGEVPGDVEADDARCRS
jgi:hypothetical protein